MTAAIRFDGKVVVITGAGGGIGRAHALAFAGAGARVVVNDLGSSRSGQGSDPGPVEKVADEIRARGGDAVVSTDSITTREGADRLLWTALSRFGRVDVLINNAGILRDRTFLNLSDEDWRSVLDVHLNGTFFCAQTFARQLKLQGEGGRILNTTSMSGLLGNFGQANYAAAKAGIYGLTRTLALELEKARITVNALAPIARTRMTEDLPAFQGAPPEAMAPEHVATVALFLASDAAASITGQVVGVEGGRVFLYRMERGDGLERTPQEGPWTPEALAAAWERLANR